MSDKPSKIFVYMIDPIDSWDGWVELSSFVNDTLRFTEGDIGRFKYTISALIFLCKAMEVAKSNGWEGDIRSGNGPFMAPLPMPDYTGPNFVMAWKQDNNGATFVASPRALPWLHENKIAETEWLLG